jgi:hypothetical protein
VAEAVYGKSEGQEMMLPAYVNPRKVPSKQTQDEHDNSHNHHDVHNPLDRRFHGDVRIHSPQQNADNDEQDNQRK